jgi:hypothetical protein
MKKRDAVCIGDIYGKMLNPLRHSLRESKNKNAFGDQPELKGKGPHADGYNKALNDEKEEDEENTSPKLSKRQQSTKDMEDRLKDPKLSTDEKKKIKKQIDLRTAEESEEEIFVKENRKNVLKMVNNSMSKSVFDKLYNKFLKENFGQEDNDIDALGLDDSSPDSDFGDEFGGDEMGDEEGDSVTFTLDRATAQTLIDVLQGALGEGEEDLDDEGDDLDFGDEDGDEFGGDDDFGGDFEEDEETQGTKPAVDKKKAFQGKSNKVSGPPAPKSGKAKTDVTDEVGTKDGAPSFAALQGKNNQVPSSTLKKATDYFK